MKLFKLICTVTLPIQAQMPTKPIHTKGTKPVTRKTTIREQPLDRRVRIASRIGQNSSYKEAEIWKDEENPPSARTIRKIREKAKGRAEIQGLRNGKGRKPLGDITHVENGPRYRPIGLNPKQKKTLVEKALSSRIERRKTAEQHCSDFYNSTGKKISPSYFTQIMYNKGVARKQVEYKPKLTRKHRDDRVFAAQELLKILKECPESLSFMDAANIRQMEEDTDCCWQRQDEGFHEDVKVDTLKNNHYSCGQFFGVITLGEKNGPSTVFTTESKAEKDLSKTHLSQLNTEQHTWLGFTHALAMVARQRDEENNQRRFPGSTPSLTTHVENHRFVRTASKGGVDWYRFIWGFIFLYVLNWYQNLSRTRPAFRICMDNAGPHHSVPAKYFFGLWGIVYFPWPPQSPDLNPIEQVWDYIRKRIKERRKNGRYPANNKEMIAAWREEWENIPQDFINKVILYTIEICERVIAVDGDNSFHG
jgi:transposase